MFGKSFAYALRALRKETIGFRFDYHVTELREAGPADSLHYYVWSDQLFLEDMDFDSFGVPKKCYRAQGPQYNPLFIAWWGLHNLQQHLRSGEQASLERCLDQVRWLKANAVLRPDGAVVWPCYFDWQEGQSRLRAPWISAMYQSVAISLLVRGYRLTGDSDLLDLCLKATRVFKKHVDEGGVRTLERGHVLYEEYPVYPLPRVLDGFLFSLLGLYDLAVQTNSTEVWSLFNDGVSGLKRAIWFWDYRGKWTWYGSHQYLCPPHYHALNRVLVGILARLTGDQMLTLYANRWHHQNLSILDQTEVFLMFVLTKNWARLRLPRN